MNFNIFMDNLAPPSDLFACRVCLATDIKLFDIHECDLAESFEAVMGLNVPPDDGMPQHLCHYCFYLLQKFASFKDKCNHSQSILQAATLVNQSITTEYIRMIDREAESLSLSLAVHDTGTIDYEIIENVVECDPDDLDGYPHKVEDEEYLDDELTDTDNKDTIVRIKEEMILGGVDNDEEDQYQERPRATGDHDMYIMQGKEATKKVPYTPAVPSEEKAATKTRSVLDHPNIEVRLLSLRDQQLELRARKLSVGYLTAVHKCSKCYKGFVNASAHRNHMALHDPSNGDFECPVCLMRFPTAAKMRLHIATAHQKKYRCTKCAHVTHNSYRALEHQRWHEMSYNCKYCGESFPKATDCMSHVRSEHTDQYPCALCDESFDTWRRLNAHIALQHPDMKSSGASKTWLYCGECNCEFNGIEAFNTHVTTASPHLGDNLGNIKYCKQCGESYRTETQLKDHQIVHIDDTVKCPGCKKVCSSHEELTVHCHEQHEPADTGLKFMCEICGRGLGSALKLLTHRRIHMRDKPYVCPYCQKPFRFPQYLQIHVRTHTGERPYVCNLCDMSFLAKANLNRHFKVHTGDKPYMCELCGKSFTQSNSMKLHVKTVHLKMPDPYRDRRKFYRNKNRPPGLAPPPALPAAPPAPPAPSSHLYDEDDDL